MSLLEDPGTKKTYDECKYMVKMWEHNFTKIFKRIPSKLDIKEAPVEVRRAYREYFNIKAAVIEESFMDVEGILKDEESNSIIEPITTCNQDSNITSDSDLIAQIQLSNDDFSIEQTPENRKNSIISPEDGFSDNQVCEDVWGTHLNKKKSPIIEKVKEISGPSEPVLSITKKLFCGSKFSKPKRNPRKSYLSHSSTKKNCSTQKSVADSGTFSFASFKSEDAIQYLQNEISTNETTSNSTSFSSTFQSFFSQSTSLNVTDKFKEKSQLRNHVDTGWLERISNNTGISLENSELPQVVNNTKLDYDSDDIIGNSDEEESSSTFINSSIFHVAKRARLDNVGLENAENSVNKTPLVNKINNIISAELTTTLEDNISNISLEENITDNNLIDSIENIETRKEGKKKISNTTIKKSSAKLKAPKSNKLSPLRRSLRENKVKSSLEELESGDEDPFASENLSDDPDFSLAKNKKEHFNFMEEPEKTEKVKRKKGKQKNIKKTVENKPEENPIYELEYSVKRRVVTPRYESISKIIKDKLTESSKKCEENVEEEISKNSLPKSKEQQAKEKLQAKIAAGKLNENFVTINLKKKVFVKGNRGTNFSKYKKSMWKKKKNALYGPDMNMGGCDGGKLICFNCGLEGHFAAKCKAIKGDGLLPLDAHNEEQCALPSLEEASKMALESNLTIRKPKLIMENSGNEEKENNEPESASDSEAEWEDDIDDELLLAEINKLEEHVKKLDVLKYIDNCKEVKPYYQLKMDSYDIIETPEEVYEALKKFGYSSFRSGQEKAIMRILSGKSTLVTLSTGSGKSLCYQLPAYLYSQREPCISLIISPLVSLMEDQVTGIPKFLKAACLHTNQTEKQRQKILDAISLGELNVLLVSPEAVVAGEKRSGFGSLLRKLPPIAFACIDEAHCVSQWSHNFRPSYLLICRVLKESLGVKTILGLTATATTTTAESIISSLGILDGLDGVITDTPLPDNLNLTVSKDSNRDRALVNILMSDRFKNCHSIIVYCTRRDECERIAGFLRTSLKSETTVERNSNKDNKKRKRLNLQAEFYHAGLSASRRRTVQNSFMSSELRVVVATVAFGMGINKSDIRAVIHYNMPNSFESYVQEVGRAGRDGLPAQCHVFLDSQGRDENELCRHIHANSVDRHAIRKLLEKIFVPCSCKNDCPKHEVSFSIEKTVRALDLPEENISTLLCYLELHKNKYIELLSPAYTKCKVLSYGGPQEIRKAAKDCPPLAMALALHPPKERAENVAEFPIIDVASAMGWDSGICKHKLKNLEWISVDNRPKRSTLSVEFSNLGFRFLAPGNLSGEKLDEALDSLHEIVRNQEIKSVKQLHAIYELLSEVGEKTYLNCVNNDEMESSIRLKEKIREYFKSEDPLRNIEIKSTKSINEEQILNDIKILMAMYKDNQFTGKAIARIFHGIQSPNYPAVIWGRCKFWRSHLNEDFHEICRLATKEILRMR